MTGKDVKEYGEGVAIAINKKNTNLLEETDKVWQPCAISER